MQDFTPPITPVISTNAQNISKNTQKNAHIAKNDEPFDTAFDEHLTDSQIAEVMNPERLKQLLNQADAFGFVNSENLDSF